MSSDCLLRAQAQGLRGTVHSACPSQRKQNLLNEEGCPGARPPCLGDQGKPDLSSTEMQEGLTGKLQLKALAGVLGVSDEIKPQTAGCAVQSHPHHL